MNIHPQLHQQVAEHPFPLLFATISGAHLYGFPSADSDFDLRGVHVLPAKEVVGLHPVEDTIDRTTMRGGMEVDLVTHDLKKFFSLMLRNNGYVMEQLLSPLIVHSTPAHDELVALAPSCLTCHHAHHYLGFAATQWRLFQKDEPPKIKPLLYMYRVLLTGIHLMKTGEVEADLTRLNDAARLSHVTDLIDRKTSGQEKSVLESVDPDFHRQEYERLVAELQSARESSSLPDSPTAKPALNDLLIRLRLEPAS